MNVAALRKHCTTCQIPLACRLALSAVHLSISITGQRARAGRRRSGKNAPVSGAGTVGRSRYNGLSWNSGWGLWGRSIDGERTETFKSGNSRQVKVAERSTAEGRQPQKHGVTRRLATTGQLQMYFPLIDRSCPLIITAVDQETCVSRRPDQLKKVKLLARPSGWVEEMNRHSSGVLDPPQATAALYFSSQTSVPTAS